MHERLSKVISMISGRKEKIDVHWINSRDQRLDEDLVLARLGLLEILDIIECSADFLNEYAFHLD